MMRYLCTQFGVWLIMLCVTVSYGVATSEPFGVPYDEPVENLAEEPVKQPDVSPSNKQYLFLVMDLHPTTNCTF